MICSACKHETFKKHGKDPYDQQRYRCLLCGKTWIESQPKPFGRMNVPKDKAILALRMLLEGNSIRTVERLVGLAQNTILDLLELLGERALNYWETKMQNLPAMDVECDETWGFVLCKEKTRLRKKYWEGCGDAYTFLAIERTNKLILAWHVGRRTPLDTIRFADKLRLAVNGRCQITTDGYKPYFTAIPNAFGGQIDFAMLVKIYGKQPGNAAEHRYSPGEIIDIKMHSVCGFPLPHLVCTSHVERQNLSIHMAVRRMTRLTNAHSKKWENHEYHLALYFLYHNFCRVHQTLKTTPAVKAGIASEVWGVEKLLIELAKAATNS
jgi:transposase-like protein/IS1 family transposase